MERAAYVLQRWFRDCRNVFRRVATEGRKGPVTLESLAAELEDEDIGYSTEFLCLRLGCLNLPEKGQKPKALAVYQNQKVMAAASTCEELKYPQFAPVYIPTTKLLDCLPIEFRVILPRTAEKAWGKTVLFPSEIVEAWSLLRNPQKKRAAYNLLKSTGSMHIY